MSRVGGEKKREKGALTPDPLQTSEAEENRSWWWRRERYTEGQTEVLSDGLIPASNVAMKVLMNLKLTGKLRHLPVKSPGAGKGGPTEKLDNDARL